MQKKANVVMKSPGRNVRYLRLVFYTNQRPGRKDVENGEEMHATNEPAKTRGFWGSIVYLCKHINALTYRPTPGGNMGCLKPVIQLNQ